MRIGIDARFLGPEGTGLGRYIERLLHHLQELDHDEHDYVVFLRPGNEALFTPTHPRFKKAIADARWYTVREQRLMPRLIRQERIDLMHFGHFNVAAFSPVPFIATIHDIIKSEHASRSASTKSVLAYHAKHVAYSWLIRHAITRACKVLVPTDFVRSKVLEHYPVSPERVLTTYEGVDETFALQDISDVRRQAVLAQYQIRQPFLLYVGNSYPYKNLKLVLDALPQLPKDLSFVNPCARSVFYDRLAQEVQTRGLADRVVLPGYVPDADLAVLYASAALYVFPSLSEGFGLPALEAMQAGLPVAVANASCLPEVLGDAAAFFDPADSQDLVQTITRLLASESERTELRRRGFERVKRYSWRTMAEETLDVYRSCLESSR